MKTLFIETAEEFEKDWLETMSRAFNKNYNEDGFDIVIKSALSCTNLLELISKHDEIYISTAFITNYIEHSIMLFNSMMYKVAENDIRGKSLFIFRTFNAICWDNLKLSLLDKAFKHNFLYVIEENTKTYNTWVQVDIDKLTSQYS